MRAGAGIVTAGLLLSVACVAHADEAVRVVISGPKKDPIAARLEKELVALGFAPVAVGPIADCASSGVDTAVRNAGASAALCSNGNRVAVWTDDGTELKLRDTVVAKDAHADTAAMQAAEVMRANIAFREPEPVPVAPAKPVPPLMSTGDWAELERDDVSAQQKRRTEPARAPMLTAGAGVSYLMSNASSQGALSLGASIGVHRYVSVALHVDAPVSGARVTPMATMSPPDGSKVRVAPGIAGVGLEFPFAAPTSFVVPRLGANAGFAWIRATKTAGQMLDALSRVSTTAEVSDTIFAPAGWASAAFSFRVSGPLRLVVDGLFGATMGGITIRNQGLAVARWGVPLASAGVRAEVVLP